MHICCVPTALPRSVFLLRGNHESITCTKMYGFCKELHTKYGATKSKVGPRTHHFESAD